MEKLSNTRPELSLLSLVIAGQIDSPPSGDTHIASMWAALYDLLPNYPQLQDTMDFFAKTRKINDVENRQVGITPSEAAGILRAGIQADLIEHVPDFPHGFTYERYLEELSRMIEDHDRISMVESNIITRKTQTTIASRGSILDLYLQGVSKVLDKKLRVLVVGCGNGIIEKQILLKHRPEFYFGHVAVSQGKGRSVLEIKINEDLLRRNAADYIDQFVAIDIQKPTDPVTQRWSLASIRPNEMLDEGYMARVRALLNEPIPENLNYEALNILFEEDLAKLREKYPGKYDVILNPTMRHQLTPDEDYQMMFSQARLLNNGGRIGTADFAFLRKGKMYFYNDWFASDFRYRIIDWQPHSRAPMEFLRAKDSRCEEIKPHLGKVAIGGVTERTTDFLLSL